MSDDLPYRLAWSCILEIGPVKFSQAVAAFGSAKSAWEAPDRLFEQLGWGPETLPKILVARKRIDVEKEFKKCQKQGVTLLTPDDEFYPKLLKEIYDPPFLLYVLGKLVPADELSLTVVGSRRMSRYGEQVIEDFIPQLTAARLTIVSGLALGVDFKATQTAFDAGGRTISVLGSGVDLITPYTNEPLARKILSEGRGAVVSEFPLGVSPQPFYFPRRDRLLSGLSLGTLVIEAAEKSGSLITPKYALEQGREVFAVPGSIFSLVSKGTNNLIKAGAHPASEAAEILSVLGVKERVLQVEASQVLPSDPLEREIVAALGDGQEIYVDDLIRQSRLTAAEVGSTLTLMELKGMVKNIGNGYYRRV